MSDEREEKRICFLSVYRLDRRYGGPEEGGWYYTTYELEAAIPFNGTATIRTHKMDDTDIYAGGYDPDMLNDDEEDGPTLTVGVVKSWDDPVAVEAEEARLTEMYSDHKGRLVDYSITAEVYRGEMERMKGRRYC